MITFTRHIPNSITCLNLFCGCLGIMLTFEGSLQSAAYCIYAAALFDFFDGMAARMLHVKSEIGKQLDSLADVVSFGVLPGFIIYNLFQKDSMEIAAEGMNITYIAFMIPIFSALRLAKFNIDTRQTDSFIGVPTPANALLISALPYMVFQNVWGMSEVLTQPYVLASISIVMSFLLVSEIPLIALKFKNYAWKGNEVRWILILVSLLAFLVFRQASLPLIILFYILISIINNTLSKS